MADDTQSVRISTKVLQGVRELSEKDGRPMTWYMDRFIEAGLRKFRKDSAVGSKA